MKTTRTKQLLRKSLGAACAAAWLAAAPGLYANDWAVGLGYWNNPANWTNAPGVPDATGGWAIGNVSEGGTAVITNTVPNVNEAWAGNGATGGAGNITVSPGGVLNVNNWLVVARMCCPSTVPCPLSTLTVDSGTINKAGDGFVVGDNAGGMDGLGGTGQLTLKGNAVVNVTGGWFTACPGGYSTATVNMQDNAQWSMAAQDFNMGEWGHGRTVFNIKDNAALTVSRFFLGRWDFSVAVLNQSGGSIIGSGANANEWTLAGDGYNAATTNSFAFYNQSGGTLTCPYNLQIGRWGQGVFYQSGGTNTFGGWTAVGRMYSGLGVMRVSGGRTVHDGTGGTHFIIGEQGRGELTLSGTGTFDTATTLVVGHGYGGYNGTGILNLNGGTAVVLGLERFGSGSGYVNFNGTTVKPKASTPNFTIGLTEAKVFAGNAIFDTDGKDITVSQALVDGAGQGVTAIAVSNGGAGYMAPPIVRIDGDGFGATAVAQVDPSAGTVTNVLITCPGSGYSTAAVTLFGGGSTTAATLGTPVIGAVSGGGVVKNGAGILTLTGANTYSGATTVNQGTLVITPYGFSSGPVNVANSATLGLAVSFQGGQAYLPSVTMGTTAATTIAFDLGSFGNPTMAPLYISGNFAVNGQVTVNVGNWLPAVSGSVPLIAYGSRSGSGSVVLGTVPPGVQATLVDDTVNKVVYLNVTQVSAPRWEGLAGGLWDINTTTNWLDLVTGIPTHYNDGLPALFNDSALGVTTVDLVATVKPASVIFTNDTLSYTLVGTGKVSGATSVIKQGTNSLAILNSNDYTGPTVISGGTLAVTNLANGGAASAIGKSTSAAANLVLAGGTLSYAGPAVTIDRAYSIQAGGSTINAQGDLTIKGNPAATVGGSLRKSGAAKLTYTGTGTNELSGGGFPGINVVEGPMVFDGSAGAQVNHSQNEVWVGGTPDTQASLVLTNTKLNIDSWFAVGRGNGSSGVASTATLYNSALRCGAFSMGYDAGVAGNLQSPVLTFNGTSSMTNNGDSNIGESGGSYARVFLNDSSSLFSNGRLFVGWHLNTGSGASATGAVVLANSSKMYVNAWLSIANEGGVGSIVAKDNSYLWVLWDLNITDVNEGNGLFTLQDNALVEANNAYVGKGTNSTGIFNQTGGTLRTRPNNSEFHVGSRGFGTYNLSGGVVNSDGNWTTVGRFPSGTGVLNVSGGSFNHNDAGKWLQVGEEGNGTLNITGAGLVTAAGDRLFIGNSATSVGVVNLDGGTLQVRRVLGGNGPSTFNFNGGLLVAGPNSLSGFMEGLTNAFVKAGGARIDTGTNVIGIAQALVDAGGGGLTKTGNGTLNLNGANTYTGATLVNAGTLGGTGTIAGPVTVAAGAGLAPGTSIGTLTINNTLTLAGGSTSTFEISKNAGTCDAVVGLTSVSYGGTLVLKNLGGVLHIGDSFKLFTAGSYTGSFTNLVSKTIGQTVTWDTSTLGSDGTVKVANAVAAPVKITPVVGGGAFTLSWPEVGWLLQVQTNSLSVGLSNNWISIPASTATNSMSFPAIATPGAGFFRLTFP